jgi:hypothetical protein
MLNPIFGPLRDWMVRKSQINANLEVSRRTSAQVNAGPRQHMEAR